jgi:mannonate dehydratase
MGIDPSSPRCDAFYEAMARLNIPLLSHAGGEVALPSHVTQDVNNPLWLRRALDHGVRVIVAHSHHSVVISIWTRGLAACV